MLPGTQCMLYLNLRVCYVKFFNLVKGNKTVRSPAQCNRQKKLPVTRVTNFSCSHSDVYYITMERSCVVRKGHGNPPGDSEGGCQQGNVVLLIQVTGKVIMMS